MRLSPEIVREGMFVRGGSLVGVIRAVRHWGIRVDWADGRTGLLYWDRTMVPCAFNLETAPGVGDADRGGDCPGGEGKL